MATWDDVRRIALALPETTERSSGEGVPQWRVKDKLFAWERPLRRADLEALGDAAPEGAILATRVTDLGVKEALLAEEPDVYFTTPHFNGYPAILVRLDRAPAAELEELLVDAWLARAPKRLLSDCSDARVSALSEHHATVSWPEAAVLPQLGAVLRVIPNHVCAAVNLADELVVATGSTVAGRWRVAARGANH